MSSLPMTSQTVKVSISSSRQKNDDAIVKYYLSSTLANMAKMAPIGIHASFAKLPRSQKNSLEFLWPRLACLPSFRGGHKSYKTFKTVSCIYFAIFWKFSTLSLNWFSRYTNSFFGVKKGQGHANKIRVKCHTKIVNAHQKGCD